MYIEFAATHKKGINMRKMQNRIQDEKTRVKKLSCVQKMRIANSMKKTKLN